MSENIRDLAIGIGWRIDDRALRRADRATDAYRDSVQDTEREIESLSDRVSDLGSDFSRASNRAERGLGGVEGAAEDVQSSIRGIPDPEISGRRAERELGDIEGAAEGVDGSIRGIPDPEIDGSQARRELQEIEDEAINLQDIISAIGGGAAGGVIGSDITSFAQMPREFQAQLGMTKSLADEMTEITKSLWTEIPNITRQGAYEAVSMANMFHDATGERAHELGRDIAFLMEQEEMGASELARSANLIVKRFEDIDSPDQAYDLLTKASQRLSKDTFEELIDNTEEYGGNIAGVGLLANDFFSAMIEGGERSRYVMDRLGDSLANELIANIRGAEEDTQLALEALAGSADEAERWQNSIIDGGPEGRSAILEITRSLGMLEDEQKRGVLGGELFGEMYKEQEKELLPILTNLGKGFDDLGGNVEDLAVRNEGPLNTFKSQLKGIRLEIDQMTGGALGEFSELFGMALPFAGGLLAPKLLGKMKGFFSGGGGAAAAAGTEAAAGSSLLRGVRGMGKIAGRAAIPLAVGLSAYDIATAEEGERGAAIGRGVGGLGGAAAGAALGSVIPGVGTIIGGVAGGIAGSIGGGKLGDWIQGLDFSAIGDKVREAKDDAVDWLKQLPGEAAEQLGYMTGRATTELQELPGEFSDWFKQSKDNAIQWVAALPGEIGEFLSSVPGEVAESIGGIWDSFMELGSSIPDAIISGFNRAKKGLGSVGNWVIDKVSQGIEGAKNLGRRFGEGFERGNVPAHAIGGIFGRPHFALFAEAGREAVIPIDQHRDRALNLWAETGRLLGVQAFAKGGFIGQIREAFTPSATPAVAIFGAGGPIFQSYVTVEYNGSGSSEQDVEKLARTIDRRQEQNFDRLMNKWSRKQLKLRPRVIER